MPILIIGVILLILLILVLLKIRRFNKREEELDKIDNFSELNEQIDRDLTIAERQDILIDKVNKLKEKQNSVEAKLED